MFLDEESYQVRPLSWLLAGALIAVCGAIGVWYFENPLILLAVVLFGSVALITVGGLLWFVQGWRRDLYLQHLRHERRRAGLCEQCGQRLRETDELCLGCGALVLRERDPVTGQLKPLGGDTPKRVAPDSF